MQDFGWEVREKMREREGGGWRKGDREGKEERANTWRGLFSILSPPWKPCLCWMKKTSPLFYRITQFEINIHGFEIIH